MTPENSPTARTTLLRVTTITWLMLISAAVVINHVTLSKVVDQSAQKASNAQVIALDERVRDLTTWVEQWEEHQSTALSVTHYEADRVSLTQQLTAIEQMLDKQLSAQDLQELQRRIELIETRPTIVQSPPKAAAQRRTAIPPKPIEPSFQIIGIERRGDERFLSLLPKDATSLTQTQLLRLGEAKDGWQLNTIEGADAVFQKATHVRRLVIPQQQVRP